MREEGGGVIGVEDGSHHAENDVGVESVVGREGVHDEHDVLDLRLTERAQSYRPETRGEKEEAVRRREAKRLADLVRERVRVVRALSLSETRQTNLGNHGDGRNRTALQQRRGACLHVLREGDDVSGVEQNVAHVAELLRIVCVHVDVRAAHHHDVRQRGVEGEDPRAQGVDAEQRVEGTVVAVVRSVADDGGQVRVGELVGGVHHLNGVAESQEVVCDSIARDRVARSFLQREHHNHALCGRKWGGVICVVGEGRDVICVVGAGRDVTRTIGEGRNMTRVVGEGRNMTRIIGAERDSLVIQILSNVSIRENTVFVNAVVVLAEGVASRTASPPLRLVFRSPGMGLYINGARLDHHKLNRRDASRAARVAQATVDDSLNGHRRASDRAADAAATVDTVLVVERNGEKRLQGIEGRKRDVAVDSLAEGLAGIVVHPADFVHVFGREARLGDAVLVEDDGDGLCEVRIHVHMLMSVHVGGFATHERNESLHLVSKRSNTRTWALNSFTTSSTETAPSCSAAMNPSFPRNWGIPSFTTIREGMLPGSNMGMPSEMLRCSPMHKPTSFAFFTADGAEEPFT